jgi:hypothetical protein
MIEFFKQLTPNQIDLFLLKSMILLKGLQNLTKALLSNIKD